MKFPGKLRNNIKLAKDYLESAAASQISVKSRTNAYYNVKGAFILFRISACTKGKLFSVEHAMTLDEIEQFRFFADRCRDKFIFLAREIQSCVKRERLIHERITS